MAATREYKRQWLRDHPGAAARYAKTWREANLERSRAAHRVQARAYAAAHREQERQRVAKWRTDHPDRAARSRALYYEKNAAKCRERTRAYRTAHPEQYRHYRDEYKRLKRAGGRGRRLPFGYKTRLFATQGGRCNACHGALIESGFHVDHVKALARGGEHVIENLQLLCPTCNRRKSDKDFATFLRELGQC
jgi:5-methylcytosine-specific restriction endonuclease McrA